jgi:5,10-methenyltetrahydromethanopterin hydrogenase
VESVVELRESYLVVDKLEYKEMLEVDKKDTTKIQRRRRSYLEDVNEKVPDQKGHGFLYIFSFSADHYHDDEAEA